MLPQTCDVWSNSFTRAPHKLVAVQPHERVSWSWRRRDDFPRQDGEAPHVHFEVVATATEHLWGSVPRRPRFLHQRWRPSRVDSCATEVSDLFVVAHCSKFESPLDRCGWRFSAKPPTFATSCSPVSMPGVSRMLCGLISRWTMSCLCRHAIPFASCSVILHL